MRFFIFIIILSVSFKSCPIQGWYGDPPPIQSGNNCANNGEVKFNNISGKTLYIYYKIYNVGTVNNLPCESFIDGGALYDKTSKNFIIGPGKLGWFRFFERNDKCNGTYEKANWSNLTGCSFNTSVTEYVIYP